ncbi:MAG: YdeI/OmpD-associated family protein [Chitinophagales bacterium]
MKSFSVKIFKIGVNPYVLLPKDILKYLFIEAGKNKGPIPVSIIIYKQKFAQTLVKYSGKWRLYLNTPMRKAAKKDADDTIKIKIGYDSKERKVPMHPQFETALKNNKKAWEAFEKLTPSRQKEISRYLNHLKTQESLTKNINRAISFLQGKDRFVGRNNP